MSMSPDTNLAASNHSLIQPLVSITESLDFDAMFKTRQPMELELGSGDGSFLVKYASLNPGRNFVGVERLLGRLRKLDRKARRAGLMNLRLFRIEASYLLEYLAPPGLFDAIHVYFPDPWPKRKHRKNRLINERFVELAHRALKPGGRIFLRTDDQDYFAQMNTVFGASQSFSSLETPAELAGVVTDFEHSFNAEGIPTLRAAFRRS
ncbi:MAG: tRNA (guanosine(46)-N7)-methyltransferase TrmB [Pedosphaera sp.]|nr:tRNA (guanosine(46)-N7)-methyltransferase TrmB [Pedosphaera sp.]